MDMDNIMAVMPSSEEDSDRSDEPDTTTEDDPDGPVLTQILLESQENSASVYWDENGKHFYGYFVTPHLTRKENEPYTYSIICHRQKVHSNALRKKSEKGCKYRFR